MIKYLRRENPNLPIYCALASSNESRTGVPMPYAMHKRVFDLVKDFGTSQSTKIDSIFDSLLCLDRPAYVTIPYCTSTASCSCTTPS
ncbi:MAG: hypothetical protein KZQ61_04555 [Candidatus Thiodiazotropha sp. (ex Lucinoma aequizonata)]|nr:hypothetical protein [Candidatus Thiodiazotropha sp. (ex Lucinoma aequizonata)]